MPDRETEADRDRAALRAFMDKKGLKELPWAKKAGVSPRTIGNFLAGRSSTLEYKTLQALAKAAGVTVEEMIPSARARLLAVDIHSQENPQRPVAGESDSKLSLSDRDRRSEEITELTERIIVVGETQSGA